MKQATLAGCTLVDTSVFVDYFRSGKGSLIASLAINDEIALSQIVRFELLKGARRAERPALQNFLEGLRPIEELPPPTVIEKTLFLLHGRGINLGLVDILILSDAIRMQCRLLSSDKQMLKASEVLKLPAI